MTIIGLSGKKQSGKDTVARMIMSCLRHKHPIKLAFADSLKEEVARACNVTVAHIEANKEQFRPILQWWGTDFKRKAVHDYWIRLMLRKIEHVANNFEPIIISDVRFRNEFDMVKINGGFNIRIVRTIPSISTDVHQSELDLDGNTEFDATIHNSGTIEDLANAVTKLLTTHSLI